MASAAVLIPLSTINQNGGVLPPSALVQHSARHGRSRGASMKGKGGRGRGYSVLEERDVTMAKAVSFVLKRSVPESEAVEEDNEEDKRLRADVEGWVSVADMFQQPKFEDLGATLEDIQRVASSSKARFTLRQVPGANAEDAAAWQVRPTTKRNSITAPVIEGEPLTADADDLPEYVVYETSYQAYPLILASGGIKRAGGTTHLSFTPVSPTADADIGIWIQLRSAMEVAPEIKWQRTESGGIVTADEIPKDLWKKVVARRSDVGLLFEDGEVRGEVPEALRGKGTKGKGKKSKGPAQGRADEDSGSSSANDE